MESVSTQLNPSENIIQLRALVKRIEEEDFSILDAECKKTINNLKNIIYNERLKLASGLSIEEKVSGYERLCSKIIMLLNQIKFK